MRVIFTDLDGTLLDSSYRFDAARPALACCHTLRVPLTAVSSKTLSEMVLWAQPLGLTALVYENGFGIALQEATPPWLKPRTLRRFGYHPRGTGPWFLWEQEFPDLWEQIQRILARFPKDQVRPATELSEDTWVQITGLPREMVRRARNRRGVPPLWVAPELRARVAHTFREAGFRVGEGRHFITVAPYDKGTAVQALVAAVRARHPHAQFLALGDQPADEAMAPFVDRFVKVHGPEQWNQVVLRWLSCPPEGLP